MLEPNYLILIIILSMCIILILFGLSIQYSKKYYKLFKTALSTYIFWSFIIITVFSLIYLSIICFNIIEFSKSNHLPQGQKYTESMLKDLINSINLKNIPLNYYVKSTSIPILLRLYFDSFYFSVITFFTIGYGDITVSGAYRIFVIIESFIGVAFTATYVSILISKILDNSKQEDVKMKISSGWDLIYVNEIEKNKVNLIFLTPECHVEIEQIKFDDDLLKFLKNMQIHWNFNNKTINDKNYFIRFCRTIHEILLECNYSASYIILKPIIKSNISLSEIHVSLMLLFNKFDKDIYSKNSKLNKDVQGYLEKSVIPLIGSAICALDNILLYTEQNNDETDSIYFLD